MKNSITEESCSNYKAKGWKKGEVCDKEMMCMDCSHDPSVGCFVPKSYNVFTLDKWGSIAKDTAPDKDVELMMLNEIQQNGPIACGVDANPLVTPPYKGGIVKALGKEIDHDISVIGYGVEDGVK